MKKFDFLKYCIPCNAWCCKGENPYASKSELAKLHVNRISQIKDRRCIFLRENNTCSQYLKRPLECRIFPYDIKRINGNLSWVVWTKCKAESYMVHDNFLKEFERDLPKRWSLNYVISYVCYHKDHQPDKYSKLKYKILRPLIWRK